MEKTSDENWEDARRQIDVGTIVSGTVEVARPFGVFVKLDVGPTALLLLPHFERQPIAEEEYPRAGDRITAFVRVIDDEKRQIGLTQILDEADDVTRRIKRSP